MLFEDPDSGDTSTYMHLLPLPKSTSSSALLLRGRDLLIALFSTEIAKRVAMDVYKTAKCTPRATSLDDIDNAGNTASKVIEGDVVNPIRRPSQQQGWDRALWTDEECGVELLLCIHDVVTRSPDSIGTMSFDKDDALGMRFVCAASNVSVDSVASAGSTPPPPPPPCHPCPIGWGRPVVSVDVVSHFDRCCLCLSCVSWI